MKRTTFFVLLLISFLGLNAASYENLYVVGNASEAGWDPDKAIAMTPGETPGTFNWTGTLLDNTGDNGQRRFKFLVQRGWNPSITCRFNEGDGHQLITSGETYQLYERAENASGPDVAFQVSEDGIYTINIDLNTMQMTCTKTGSTEDPTINLMQLYLVGSATEAGWDPNAAIAMDIQSEGVFTWTGNLSTANGNEFKFLNELGTWHKTIVAVGSNIEFLTNTEYNLNFRPKESSPDDYKFIVTTPGVYTIHADLNSMKIIINSDKEAGLKSIYDSNAPFKVSVNHGIVSIYSLETMADVEIFDLAGKTMQKSKNIQSNYSTPSSLNKGVYILKVRSDSRVYSSSIIIR